MKKSAFNRNRKGNLFLTFILLVAVAAVFMSFFFVLIGRVRNLPQEKSRVRAFYTAEAGIQKAIWNLTTPSGLGGQGSAWRTSGSTEAFGGGQYTITVLDGASGSITITSTGEVGGAIKSLQQRITSSSLPAAFNYAVYNNGNFELEHSAVVKGDIYANGNIEIDEASNHPEGAVYVSAGHTVNELPGTAPETTPSMPTLNTTYYDTKITQAGTYPAGNQTISSQDLAGGVIYVHGNATINGTITGGGIIVATGTVNIQGATISPNTTIISNGEMLVNSTTNVQTGGILYSPSRISIPGNSRISGSILSAVITASGTPTIYGILYSWNVSTTLSGTVNIYGSVVNPSETEYEGHITIEYDLSYLPSAPPGISGGGFSVIKGSFRELN
ncbi:MAG: hypothetical protein AABZ57_00895 [Candidatus Margulisiibacteriota bacterium]